MSDDIDLAQEINERFQQQAIEHARKVAAAPRRPKKCEHCEENPAEIVNGVQLKYCPRCRDELTPKRIVPTSCHAASIVLPAQAAPAPERTTEVKGCKHFTLRGGKLQAAA